MRRLFPNPTEQITVAEAAMQQIARYVGSIIGVIDILDHKSVETTLMLCDKLSEQALLI